MPIGTAAKNLLSRRGDTRIDISTDGVFSREQGTPILIKIDVCKILVAIVVVAENVIDCAPWSNAERVMDRVMMIKSCMNLGTLSPII